MNKIANKKTKKNKQNKTKQNKTKQNKTKQNKSNYYYKQNIKYLTSLLNSSSREINSNPDKNPSESTG